MSLILKGAASGAKLMSNKSEFDNAPDEVSDSGISPML